jgi:hypothetical protein
MLQVHLTTVPSKNALKKGGGDHVRRVCVRVRVRIKLSLVGSIVSRKYVLRERKNGGGGTKGEAWGYRREGIRHTG